MHTTIKWSLYTQLTNIGAFRCTKLNRCWDVIKALVETEERTGSNSSLIRRTNGKETFLKLQWVLFASAILPPRAAPVHRHIAQKFPQTHTHKNNSGENVAIQSESHKEAVQWGRFIGVMLCRSEALSASGPHTSPQSHGDTAMSPP